MRIFQFGCVSYIPSFFPLCNHNDQDTFIFAMKGRKIKQFHFNLKTCIIYRLASGSGATVLMQIILWPSIEVEILFVSILLYLHHTWRYGSTYQERKRGTMWKKWDESGGDHKVTLEAQWFIRQSYVHWG